MDGQKELGAAIVGGLDNLLQVCFVRGGGVHCGVVDGMTELLQLGDQGSHHGTVDLTLTKALVFGSITRTARSVPCVYAYSNSSHPLSLKMVSKYKRK